MRGLELAKDCRPQNGFTVTITAGTESAACVELVGNEVDRPQIVRMLGNRRSGLVRRTGARNISRSRWTGR